MEIWRYRHYLCARGFSRTCYPGLEIVDFPISSTFTRLKALKRVTSHDDIVTIVGGGGNMGDLHYTIEDCEDL